MTRTRWAALTLSLILLGLSSIVGLVMLIDPFQIYHKATAFIPPIDNGYQIYANAGIAKSYDYDSIVIGSSMTENFTPSQLDALFGGSFVKLSVNAGTPFNHKQMLDMAYANQEIKRVLYGLDIELMASFYTTPKCEMPEYLYDKNLLNDVYYWFNTSVLTRYIPKCLKTLGQTDPDQRDTMYNWGSLYPYGRDVVLGDLTLPSAPVEQYVDTDIAVLAQAYKLNVENNLLPFVEGHPETEFMFFFSPYSAVRWVQFYGEGRLEYYLNQKAAIAAAMLPYENVKIYDFQAQTQWITNLDLYIDVSHYSPQINDAMAEMMAADTCRIMSVEDILASNAVLRKLVDQIVAAGRWPDSFTY